MALSDTQKAKIRLYLGYSGRFFQVDTVLEQAMEAVTGLPELQTEIETLLARLAALDTKLSDAEACLKVLKAGNVELDGHRQIATLRSQGRLMVGRLAAILGVGVRHNAFSAAATAAGGNYMQHG